MENVIWLIVVCMKFMLFVYIIKLVSKLVYRRWEKKMLVGIIFVGSFGLLKIMEKFLDRKKILCFVMYMIYMKKLLIKRLDECNFDNYLSEKFG